VDGSFKIEEKTGLNDIQKAALAVETAEDALEEQKDKDGERPILSPKALLLQKTFDEAKRVHMCFKKVNTDEEKEQNDRLKCDLCQFTTAATFALENVLGAKKMAALSTVEQIERLQQKVRGEAREYCGHSVVCVVAWAKVCVYAVLCVLSGCRVVACVVAPVSTMYTYTPDTAACGLHGIFTPQTNSHLHSHLHPHLRPSNEPASSPRCARIPRCTLT
jgi:hypothetical protein